MTYHYTAQEFPACPDCGEGFAPGHHKRNGWHYAGCGRRWHEEYGWASAHPRGCLGNQLDREKDQNKGLRAVVDPIDRLRAEEGSGVIIPNDNPDVDGPRCAVEVFGPWTNYVARRFEGDTLADALAAAEAAKGDLP